ncbi:biogenesis of lysosome-related organelles complex 1 subunit 1 [Eupeodes corollae]|uniref:biogenesis of lysosome-related organelles complex 1 subunit 1 n=1 Tax=Eupeodes corollae TaxID=290404 RepID=UPI002492BB67|nr:biogenesis of lysosome-related organelles complex 1 subunit 1 [Eupeodes corollae]
MLNSMVKEHQARQAKRKEEQEIRRKEAIESSNELTQALVDHLNVGVAQAYLNQKRLDAEAKQLHVGATNFAKQTHQWLQLIDNFSSALKELGDVENWARSIETDMQTIQGTLEIAYKTSRQPTSSSTTTTN